MRGRAGRQASGVVRKRAPDETGMARMRCVERKKQGLALIAFLRNCIRLFEHSMIRRNNAQRYTCEVIGW